MKLSDCTKEPFSAKACSGDFSACLSLHRTACSHVSRFLYQSLAYLKMNAQTGRFRGQRNKSASPRLFHPSLQHMMENMLSFLICCGAELFLDKPLAFFTSPVIQKARQRGEGCSMKGSNFSVIYCQMHTVHVFAGWTVPQWTALLLCLMACKVWSVFLFPLFLDLGLRNSSYIDVNLGCLT